MAFVPLGRIAGRSWYYMRDSRALSTLALIVTLTRFGIVPRSLDNRQGSRDPVVKGGRKLTCVDGDVDLRVSSHALPDRIGALANFSLLCG